MPTIFIIGNFGAWRGRGTRKEGTPPWWRDQLLITSEGEIGVTSSGESGIGGPTPSCVLSFDEESLSGKQLSLLNLAIIPLAKAKIRCEGRTFFNKKKNDKTFDGYFSLYQNLDPQYPNFIASPHVLVRSLRLSDPEGATGMSIMEAFFFIDCRFLLGGMMAAMALN